MEDNIGNPATEKAPSTQPVEGTTKTPTGDPKTPTTTTNTIDKTITEPTPKDSTVSFAPTGDPGLDMALGFVGRLGFGEDHQAVKAAFEGDFSLIKAELASKGDKAQGWEQYIALAEKAYATSVADKEQTAKATRLVMNDVFGGEENTIAVLDWARANAEPHEREELNSMINAGGIQARAASMWLNAAYGKSTGTVREPSNPAKQQSVVKQSNGQALSSADFSKEVATLVSTMGPRFSTTPEYASLVARRKAYRG